jgi:parallel beta-helix repeat protein
MIQLKLELSRCYAALLLAFGAATPLMGSWYVSPSGTDVLTNNNGSSPSAPLKTISYAINTAWAPGDTVFVMNGTYQNNNYGSGLNNGSVVSINATGTPNGWLIIRNYPGHTPKIQFDGAGGFTGSGQTYLEISGFEIEGPNQSITYNDAIANRLIKDKFYTGRGIAIWSGHHINIHDNVIHDCPNSGIRINNGDYCNIHHNEVYNNTWWSSSAESAIVYATAQDIDTLSIIKMQMTHNLVYDNINYIPFYTGAASGYGSADQDYIIDGSGCYITRNQDTYVHGWFYMANNVTYGNGINGVVVHKSDRAIVTNNTAYRNGAVPLSSGRQASSGITIHSSSYVKVYNNISWPRFDTDYGYKIFNSSASNFIEASNNILAKGLSDYSSGQYVFTDPKFVDTANFDLQLTGASPAIDSGKVHVDLPDDDFLGITRLQNPPDIGAYEYVSGLQVNPPIDTRLEEVVVYPNPTQHSFTLQFSEVQRGMRLDLISVSGELLESKNLTQMDKVVWELNYPKGLYFLKVYTTSEEIKVLKIQKM